MDEYGDRPIEELPDFDLHRTAGAIPEGLHSFRVVDVTSKPGPSGYPNVTCICECQEGSEFDGQRVWHNISMSPAARWKLEEFLDAVGAPEDGVMNAGGFKGLRFRGWVKHEEYQGKMRPRLDKILPVDGPVPNVTVSSSQPALPLTFEPPAPARRGKKPELPLDVIEEE